MMKWWQGILLGMLQGATEFLPVSSSGHLALAQSLLKGFRQPGVLFDLTLHLATALAVVVYFYQDLIGLLGWKPGTEVRLKGGAEEMAEAGKWERVNWSLIWMLVLALIPTALLGFLFKDFAEAQFQNPLAVGFFLILTGLLLFGADFFARAPKVGAKAEPKIWQALLIGTAQGLAVFPGLSRSGATISMGIFTGLRGDSSVRFSFLLSVPAVLGASLVSVWEERTALAGFQSQEILSYLLGMVSAFLVGYLSIWLVFWVVRRIRLSWFGGYCLVLGLLVVLIWNLNK